MQAAVEPVRDCAADDGSTQEASGSLHAYPASPHSNFPPEAQVHEQQSPPSYPAVVHHTENMEYSDPNVRLAW